jgi:glutamate dehydrogenase/leucine dehydrogenase
MSDVPIIERNRSIDGERFALVVTTHHDGAVATTAIHRQDFQRHIGGARFVEETGGLSEVGHLASTMTEKCMAAMIPADGQKTVIVAGPLNSFTDERRADILVEHVRVVKEMDPGIIVGPDMNNPVSVEDLAAQAEGLLDHFTGLSEAFRGLSIDTNGYTAYGLVTAIRACVDDVSLAKQRVSIGGFGAVGAHTARLLEEFGARIVAVNNKDVLLTKVDGLDVPALFAHRLNYGDDGLKWYAAKGVRVSYIPDEIYQVPADIFVPAARTDILAMSDELEHVRRSENPDVCDVVDFHAATGISLVVEGANHPISSEAERWLESKGVRILPDFIVNCGGLIGCWAEWEARHRDGLRPVMDLARVGQAALERIRATVSANVKELLAGNMSARDAAEHIVRRNREKLLGGPSIRNQAEALARSELRALRFDSAVTALREAMALDPARAERLQNEFGFLLLAYGEDGNVLDASAGAADRLQWCARIWRTIAAGNDLPLLELKSAGKEAAAAQLSVPILKAQEGTAEQKGDALEDAVARLFRTFFRIGEDIPWKIRKQKRGSQYGHDLSIEWSGKFDAVGEPRSRCHIECKNFRDEIRPANVSEKLLSEPLKQPVIDHWILISPRSDPSNELTRFLEKHRQNETFPFGVQVWSPEVGIDQFFGLEPAVYDLFYQPREGEPHPRDWDEAKRNEVRRKWRDQLDPLLRLPLGWRDYLREPALLCIHQEDPATMAQTYETRVAMRCRNDAGAPLEKPLDDYIDDWLSSDDPVCILLGEFGDGKSFFTYSLARRLAADWRKSADSWLPLRLALRRLPPDPRDFLRQRLEEFGADVAGWNAIGKITRRLVILDGFDEMSINLDPNTVTANIRKLLACMDEFAGCKILITSRKHFFQSRKDARRLLTRTGEAQIYTLAPIPRSEVIRNVTGAAADAERRQMTERFRSMHDPIGLAGKPLFLEMLKDVIVDPELPTADFDVVTLYEHYITRSLSRKLEGLDDPELQTERTETITNLRAVLSEIAEVLQRTGLGYVRLGEFKSATKLRFAELLWRQSGPEALDLDAKARIGGRSLLGRVDTDDAVDFCHRSMREYFVAERLCTALKTNRKEAEAFLRDVPVNHEILQFAVQQLHNSGSDRAETTLLALLECAVQPPPAGVGGRAATLLYQLKGDLPANLDWRGKNFDGVDLEGANLSRLDFTGSSLRNANLTNVNFEDSNFSGCDFTGVRIEETKPVAALAADPSGERIIAAYSDGALRSWEFRPDGRSVSTLVGEWPAGVGGSIGLHESGQVWLHANDEWWLLNRQESGLWEPSSRFRIADGVACVRPRASVLAVTRTGLDDGAPIALLVDLERNGKLFTATTGATRHCVPIGSEGIVWSDASTGLLVETMSSSGLRRSIVLPCRKPSSLDVRTRSDGMHVVAGGTEEGMVHVWTLETRHNEIVPHQIFAGSIHEGAVTDVALLEDARVASGGSDCVVSVTSWAEDGSTEVRYRLQLRLRCRGMRIEGLKSEAERLLLRKLIDDVEAVADR